MNEKEKEMENSLILKVLENKDNIINSYAGIFNDLQDDLRNVSRSLELIEENLKKLEKSRLKNDDATEKLSKDLNNSFIKLREILNILTEKKVDTLYKEIIDMNNANSLTNRIIDLFKEQNKKLTDLNNSDSVVSVLKKNNSRTMAEIKKSNNIKSFITWALVTIAAFISIIDKIHK